MGQSIHVGGLFQSDPTGIRQKFLAQPTDGTGMFINESLTVPKQYRSLLMIRDLVASLSHHARILCFSRDSHLLKTRGMVLGTLYEPVMVGSIAELLALPESECFDVVVLCHTLSTDECTGSARIVRKRWPKAKILALGPEQNDCAAEVDSVVQGMTGPKVLLTAIDRLLQRGTGTAGRI